MYYILLTLIYVTAHVDAYVLLQVRRDNQNRSNVDALIHKVVPSGQFDILAQKIARKHLSNQRTEKKIEPEPKESEELTLMNDQIKEAIQEIIEKRPEFRTNDISIKPRVINFRSNQPSLMYEVKSNVIIQALKDFLSSKLVSKYTDDMAKRAAVVFRSLSQNNE